MKTMRIGAVVGIVALSCAMIVTAHSSAVDGVTRSSPPSLP